MNKTVFVKAYFKPIMGKIKVKVPTGETKRGFFGGEKQETRTEERLQQSGWSDCEIDGVRLSNDVSAAIEELNSAGFDVVSISPITSGAYAYKYKSEAISSSPRISGNTEKVSGGGSYGYGYGYSYTEGVLVLARK